MKLRSQQNIDDYHARSRSAGGRIGIINMPSTFTFNQSKMDSTYASVIDQTGIYAGQGGFDITVGGNTDLKGAVIGSEATPDKNKLNTGTLTWSDIENEAEYKSSSTGIGYSWGNPTTKDANGKEIANPKNGITPNIGVSVSGNTDSTTKSAIAPGTIEVRSNPSVDLSGLSRDPAGALNILGKIFDKKTVQEKQELAQVFGEVAFKAVGDLALKQYTKASADAVKAQQAGDTKAYNEAIQRQAAWAIGGSNEVLLHALVGGIMSDLGGSGFASGATGAGLAELVEGRLKNSSPEIQKIGSALIGAVAAEVVGGNAQSGASTAVSGTINNGLDHEQQEKLVNDLTYAINNHSSAGIVTTLLKWSAVDAGNNLIFPGMGEGAEGPTIDLINAAAKELGVSFSYNQNDSVHNNLNSFWGAVVSSVPTVDTSTLITAGVIGTAVVVGATTIYLYNGKWVKAAGTGAGAAAGNAALKSPELLNELSQSGAKYSAENVVAITKAANGQLVWLETGNAGAGLEHIMLRHSAEFADWGLTSGSQVTQFIINTVKNGGGTSIGNGATLYNVTINGVTKVLNVVTGSNGFIVTAYPYSF